MEAVYHDAGVIDIFPCFGRLLTLAGEPGSSEPSLSIMVYEDSTLRDPHDGSLPRLSSVLSSPSPIAASSSTSDSPKLLLGSRFRSQTGDAGREAAGENTP